MRDEADMTNSDYEGQNDETAPSRLKEEAQSMLSSAKQKLGDVAEPIKDKALEVAEEQKEKSAQQIGAVANAIDGAAAELESEMPGLAGYVHDGAQAIQRVATQVRERNLEDLAGLFTDFARRQPALAFGGCVIAGFALSRFLKSSGTPPATKDTTPYQGA
jgi:hypothetical protein